jgi:hypothetical protein
VSDHQWVLYFDDGRRAQFTVAKLEACTGALLGCDRDGEACLLIRGGWGICVRDDMEVVMTPAEIPSESSTSTGRPFA